MSHARSFALLALPVVLFAADAAAQLDPGIKNYTRVDLIFRDGSLTTTSAVLTARTGLGNLTAGNEHWSLTQSFVQNVQNAGAGATLELDASAGSQYWGHGLQFPVAGALSRFTMPAVLPASGWTQLPGLPPDAFYASTSTTDNLGVAFALVAPVPPSTTWGGSITWYVLADSAPTDYLVASGSAVTLTLGAPVQPAHGHRWYGYTLAPGNP